MTPDAELLRRYAGTKSEEAFAELVQRHVNSVYSAALRQVNGDAHLAQDVAQMVFTDLARKAASLSRRETLTGWLYTSAHFAAAKMARTENRRRNREEKFMREPIHEPAPAADWEKLRPSLDDAMHELKEADREAVLLRYFENRQFVEIGGRLGLNENAARMRVERALEKLRAIFARRGVATNAALASVISANAVQIAPAGLAATFTSASLVAAGTGTSLTLLKFMTMTKLKLAISALIVAGAATALVVQHQTQIKLREENQSLRQQVSQLQSDNESLSNHVAATGNSESLSKDQFNELLKLRGEVGVLRRQVSEFGKTHEENTHEANRNLERALSEAKFTLHEIATVNAMRQLGVAMRIYLDDHGNQYATNFDQIKNELGGVPNFGDNIGLDTFEFVNAGMVDEQYPQIIMLRERNARQAPDGKWSRIYCFSDGRVQTATSDDGNFDAWEKQNTYSPPPNQ